MFDAITENETNGKAIPICNNNFSGHSWDVEKNEIKTHTFAMTGSVSPTGGTWETTGYLLVQTCKNCHFVYTDKIKI